MSETNGMAGQSRSVFSTWWPLALSWLLMGIELPMISAVIGRLPNQEIMLAAFGGVVFPVALLIESPIIMMLAASTAWSRDRASFNQLGRFMTRTAIGLTAIHALIAFTPLFDWIVVPLLEIPESVVSPARVGLQIMILWTWAIADRRFRQGALIRFGHRGTIARGTAVRLVATLGTLGLLWSESSWSGIAIGTIALSIGVLIEAAYVRARAGVLLKGPLEAASEVMPKSRSVSLWVFYIPLAITPMLMLATQPLAAAGITRMPMPLEGLALWGPAGGLIFLCRSAGIALNEVVIAHAEDAGAESRLRRFAWIWGLVFSGILAVIAMSPLAQWWFGSVIGLDDKLTSLGAETLWLAAPVPLLTFLQSHWQGLLVHQHRTRAVTASVVIFLLVTGLMIGLGVVIGSWNGLLVTLAAFTAGNTAQTLWLRWKWSIQGPTRPNQPTAGLVAPEPG